MKSKCATFKKIMPSIIFGVTYFDLSVNVTKDRSTAGLSLSERAPVSDIEKDFSLT